MRKKKFTQVKVDGCLGFLSSSIGNQIFSHTEDFFQSKLPLTLSGMGFLDYNGNCTKRLESMTQTNKIRKLMKCKKIFTLEKVLGNDCTN